MATRIVELHERDTRVFPRDELFDSEGRSLVLSKTRDLAAIDLRDVATGVELRTRGVIGYLPLTSDITLNIRPKFPVANLWEMLLSADEKYERVLSIVRTYERTDSLPPHQLLVRSFCYFLKKILEFGVTRAYYPENRDGYYRPKVNFGRSASRFFSRGNEIYTSSDVFEYSAKIPANEILKAACIDFLRVAPKDSSWSKERIVLMDALNSLDRARIGTMEVGGEKIAEGLPTWIRSYYKSALTVYSMLLGHRRVGFSYSEHGIQMPSFLFSLDNIFESFIRNNFRMAFQPHGISVSDGNVTRHQEMLFTDSRRYPIKPDLIFKKNRSIVGIAEVKYKPRIEEADRYQVISHVVALGLSVGVWISPAVNGSTGLEYVGSIKTGAKFYHYRIDLSASLVQALAQMTDTVRGLLDDSH